MYILPKTHLPLIIAHRGESYDALENTLSAINLAWQRVADGVEIDVRLSKDNKIIVIHNRKIKSTSRKNVLVKSQTLEYLKKLDVGRTRKSKLNSEKIPTLNEVLLTVPSNKYLFIEIKCGIEIIPYLKIVLGQSHIDSDQIKLIGFGLAKMSVIKNNFPEYEVFLNKRIHGGKIFPGKSLWDNLILKLKLNALDGLNVSYTKVLNSEVIEKFKFNKLKIFVWTINDSDAALQLKYLGVDGIMSDRSGWIRNQLSRL